ncbi:tRNA U34 5-methylaminomethyl-2-thiouridine-forming methyltransferase MnmC [Chitinophaga sp. CF118]|uniref:tRNA (5-methylaminomethyl-2-thiouridine)(34)-methyltransferase MnmD n=1 Tax=Chitinophaga sp. CF118 TaxID=1884367 RepID=UPI0008E5B44F|nr:tRNA (5-methylaminomethyl-2-thiouridine)(34)-methyltransferase MnmD [Chitinophaga sp. CF118]SFD13778.1 tRNA U34 5-methylaminomethyl-2-thiouridine-forming methyltransferase MnmC [Chitinophaga sp. CF118]
MKRQLYITADGSHTIVLPDMQVTYHSTYGALQESRHIFIQAGLKYVMPKDSINVFEMGFGTGLNALLTVQESIQSRCHVYYQSVELYPLSMEDAEGLNYTTQLNDSSETFSLLHSSKWEEDIMINPLFTLHKSHDSITHLSVNKHFHVIYYDAFAPDVQPELWEPVIFEKLYNWLHPGGVLVTYCSKGSVRRTMQSAGLKVEKLPGPPGKREILRAIKIN